MARIENRRLHLGTLLALVLVVASAVSLPRNYRLPKQDFTGARDFVLAEKRPGDRIVAIDLAGEVYRSYYAAGRDDFSYASSLAELEAARATEGHTWVIYTLGGYVAASHPRLWEALERAFEPVRAFPGTLGGGEVVVLCSRRLPAVTDSHP